MVKHRLAEKRAANRDAVKATGKLSILPRFDRVGVPELMQSLVTFDDLIIDPGLGPPRALSDHFRECSIDSDFETSLTHDPLEGVWNVKFVERQDRARIG